VAPRREGLNPEELERQRALDRSRAEAQRGLADPTFREYLERSLSRLEQKAPAPTLTREEFLAKSELPDE
jgi:hypothetical protein